MWSLIFFVFEPKFCMHFASVKVHPRTDYEGPEGEYRCTSTLSLTFALDEMDCQPHALAALAPGKRPSTYYIGGWAGPRAGVDACGKSRLHRDSTPGPSSCSESLYRLRFPDPHFLSVLCLMLSHAVRLNCITEFAPSVCYWLRRGVLRNFLHSSLGCARKIIYLLHA
jgi:hypothetical protein